MSAFLGLGGLIGFLVCLVLLVIKAIKKKPKKKTLIALGVCFVLFCSAFSTSTTKSEEAETANLEEPNSTNSFELIAGEPGEYGELFTINKGTEFEETYYIYRIPNGTYTVTNSGNYPDQFNIYGEKVYKTEAGYEELSDVIYVKLLGVGESDTITFNAGQIIEIHEPGRFLLEKTA